MIFRSAEGGECFGLVQAHYRKFPRIPDFQLKRFEDIAAGRRNFLDAVVNSTILCCWHFAKAESCCRYFLLTSKSVVARIAGTYHKFEYMQALPWQPILQR